MKRVGLASKLPELARTFTSSEKLEVGEDPLRLSQFDKLPINDYRPSKGESHAELHPLRGTFLLLILALLFLSLTRTKQQ
jgi:hypothetical protein